MCQRFMLKRDAARYCGMGEKQFAELVAPHIPELHIFPPRLRCRPVAHYDRNDLDAWCDAFKAKQLAEGFPDLARQKVMVKVMLKPQMPPLQRAEDFSYRAELKRLRALENSGKPKKRKGRI